MLHLNFNRGLSIRVLFYALLIISSWAVLSISQRWVEDIQSKTAEIYRELEEYEKKKNTAFIEVYFFDIRGDAMLINYSDEYQIVVDGGFTNSKLLRRIKQFMPENDTKIETIIKTHDHRDHYRGFSELLSEFDTDLFIKNFSEVNETPKEILNLQGADIKTFVAGDILKVDDLLQINFIHPEKEKEDLYLDENDKSLAFRFLFGRNSFLFMGDNGISVEEELLKKDTALRTDFLKVGHHGYSSASSEDFLNEVMPKYGVITNGHSDYDSITQEKLDSLGTKVHFASSSLDQMIAVKCFYKDDDCDIVVKTDVDSIESTDIFSSP